MPGFNELVAPAVPPKTALGRLRILSPHAGLRMSPLIFGGISLGTAWNQYQKGAGSEQPFTLLDAYVEMGGCVFDTANGYCDEESEQLLGEWMEARGNRDRMVIATKYTSAFKWHIYGKNESANLAGNSRKSLHVSLRESLKKLRTDYIDILYIHWWDFTTSIPEIMDALDVYVKQGKVLYLGASDLPAWIVSACNEYATARNQARFVVLQTKWNVMERDIERDLLPMARMYNMAIVPFSALGSGRLKPKDAMEKSIADGSFKEDSEEVRFTRTLLDIACARGLNTWAPIALAYFYTKYPLVFPLIGIENRDQLQDSVQGIDILLTPEEMRRIEDLKPLDPGFPNTMSGPDPHVTGKAEGNPGAQLGFIDWLVDQRVYASHIQNKQ